MRLAPGSRAPGPSPLSSDLPQHPTPHDDGTKPWPRGAWRTVEQIADGVDELPGKPARVSFVVGLLENGELAAHGKKLVEALAEAWGVQASTVWQYTREAEIAGALNPKTRSAVAARLMRQVEGAARLARRAAEKAESDEKPAAAAGAMVAAGGLLLSAVNQKARMLGLDGPAAAPPLDLEDDDPATVPLSGISCGPCGRVSYGDPAPRFCAHCGAPLETPAPTEGAPT